ncbi:hypothetical protein GM3709_3211 [Geminocystis sp. NIES-3709]|nr:hypothetical protein GM3709_3211 [Geminocystis sp. NIES-3709]
MIHFVGGLIYALPWYEAKSAYLIQSGANYTQVSTGFIQSVYGVIGFGIGSIILAYWLVTLIKPRWLKLIPQKPDLKLPTKLLKIGLLFFFFISPNIVKIQGLQGFSTSGIYLCVVALCLACWRSWYLGNKKQLLFWIGVSCILPIITINLLGFIGYGASASLIILIFVSSFYRPKWHTVLIGLLVFIFGLSVYVTYMRDRGEIRAIVWGNQSIESRYEKMVNTFSNFEIIDFYNQRHLEAIDTRLNQNGLVGKAVEYINDGQATFAFGETLWEAFISPIPRLLWPDKPIFAGSGNLVSSFTGQKFADNTSVGVGQVLEFYINFGSVGVFVGFLVMGIVIRIIDMAAGSYLINGDWLGYTSWFLPGMVLLQPGGSLTEITASSAASVVLVVIMKKFIIKPQKNITVLNNLDSSHKQINSKQENF